MREASRTFQSTFSREGVTKVSREAHYRKSTSTEPDLCPAVNRDKKVWTCPCLLRPDATFLPRLSISQQDAELAAAKAAQLALQWLAEEVMG